MSAVFLGGLGGDFTCAVGRDPNTDIPYICERFAGAFDLRYGGVRGSIYILPADKFLSGQTQWEEEVVCCEPVIPLQEIQVGDAREYLLQLEKEGKLIIKYYPDRIDDIPKDDEDLVSRAVIWHKQFGESVLEQVRLYHPGLLERVLRSLGEESRDR
jgi:hypothetical protein